MGWARTLLLGDIGNRLDIGDAENEIRTLRDLLRRNRSLDMTQEERLAMLERDNEQQQILIVALAKILAAHGLIDAEGMEPFIEALDDMPPSAGTIPSES
jgi:uncharacterized coiled-coil protein SlyX